MRNLPDKVWDACHALKYEGSATIFDIYPLWWDWILSGRWNQYTLGHNASLAGFSALISYTFQDYNEFEFLL